MKLKNLLTQSLMALTVIFTAHAAQEQRLSESKKKVILWDLGYVLVKPNQAKMSLQYIIPYTLGLQSVEHGSFSITLQKGMLDAHTIQNAMDAVMDHARPNEPKQTVIVANVVTHTPISMLNIKWA